MRGPSCRWFPKNSAMGCPNWRERQVCVMRTFCPWHIYTMGPQNLHFLRVFLVDNVVFQALAKLTAKQSPWSWKASLVWPLRQRLQASRHFVLVHVTHSSLTKTKSPQLHAQKKSASCYPVLLRQLRLLQALVALVIASNLLGMP